MKADTRDNRSLESLSREIIDRFSISRGASTKGPRETYQRKDFKATQCIFQGMCLGLATLRIENGQIHCCVVEAGSRGTG